MASMRNTGELSAKISKKVAELTVVVHMLFKRNHEKEVEYEYFKLLAEKEMEKIKENYEKQLAWLERQLEEQETYRAKVEYKLGDLKILDEKISALQKENDNAKQQVVAREELLRIANIEIDVLKQKVESYEEDIQHLKTNEFPRKGQTENDRLSKSATQLHVPTPVVNISSPNIDLEQKIELLEGKMESMRNEHENELTKNYAEKIKLQQKIDSYNSSVSQEIDDLKQTLEAVTSKQVSDQKQISQLEKQNSKLQENLKKTENEKKSLQKDVNSLKDQLLNSMKHNTHQKNLLALKEAVSQDDKKQRFFETRDEELERLKREIHMYRMELENREENFNRMFADKQPVVLNPNTERYLVERNLTGTRRNRRPQLPKLKEQRSLTFVNSSVRTAFQF